jgi:hypothetical protein
MELRQLSSDAWPLSEEETRQSFRSLSGQVGFQPLANPLDHFGRQHLPRW